MGQIHRKNIFSTNWFLLSLLLGRVLYTPSERIDIPTWIRAIMLIVYKRTDGRIKCFVQTAVFIFWFYFSLDILPVILFLSDQVLQVGHGDVHAESLILHQNLFIEAIVRPYFNNSRLVLSNRKGNQRTF